MAAAPKVFLTGPDDYVGQVQGLLPQGRAWLLHPTAPLYHVLHVVAQALSRLHNRAAVLLTTELDPRTADETLACWERMAGLPDATSPVPASLSARRAWLHARYTARGSQTAASLVAAADAIGIAGPGGTGSVTVEEGFNDCSRAGLCRAGDELAGPDWLHTITITGAAATSSDDRARYAALATRMRPAQVRVVHDWS